MKLVEEFSYSAGLKPPRPVGAGPFGTRMVFDVTDGEVKGRRLQGKVVGGGEWALMGPDGFIRIDVRLQIETHDGAQLYGQYFGLLELNEGVQKALENGETGTDFGDQYFYTNPRFETGDERYAWVNTTFFVGEGRILPGLRVEYRVWCPER